MSEIFEDIEGVKVLVDDILIWSKSEEEHDKILKEVLSRTRSRNLKLNMEKSQLKSNEVRYVGHMVTYLAKFIPNYSHVAVPLRLLMERTLSGTGQKNKTTALKP